MEGWWRGGVQSIQSSIQTSGAQGQSPVWSAPEVSARECFRELGLLAGGSQTGAHLFRPHGGLGEGLRGDLRPDQSHSWVSAGSCGMKRHPEAEDALVYFLLMRGPGMSLHHKHC